MATVRFAANNAEGVTGLIKSCLHGGIQIVFPFCVVFFLPQPGVCGLNTFKYNFVFKLIQKKSRLIVSFFFCFERNQVQRIKYTHVCMYVMHACTCVLV